MKNKVNFKKAILCIIVIVLLIIITFFAYDRITINNQYYISDKELEIPIFLYHNIVNEKSEIQYDYMQTTKETFEKQLVGLMNVGYHFISYDDLIKYKNGEEMLYKKSCILTFDDGCEGVYENVYPIAQKYNIPFTVFVIINNMNTNGVLTWEQAKEMNDSGLVTIASHSINHPEFTTLSTEEAIENVEKSYKIIEENIGKKETKIFTYPYGLYTPEEQEELKQKGYIQNLTDNKINKSKDLNLYGLHRCYLLSDPIYKIIAKITYRSIRYN